MPRHYQICQMHRLLPLHLVSSLLQLDSIYSIKLGGILIGFVHGSHLGLTAICDNSDHMSAVTILEVWNS